MLSCSIVSASPSSPANKVQLRLDISIWERTGFYDSKSYQASKHVCSMSAMVGPSISGFCCSSITVGVL